MINNFFEVSEIPLTNDKELFEIILNKENILIERIVSSGQVTPEGNWLEEDKDEWVLLLQGYSGIEFESGKINDMGKGDYILIPAHTKHKVIYTSSEPHCIWLAIHIN